MIEWRDLHEQAYRDQYFAMQRRIKQLEELNYHLVKRNVRMIKWARCLEKVLANLDHHVNSSIFAQKISEPKTEH
jgi:hypothetical protein